MRLLLCFLVLAPAIAGAQTRSCTLVEQLATELGCAFARVPPAPAPSEPVDNSKDFLVNSSFGPSSCKTGPALKDAAGELKTECNSWIKERKADLKEKFLTGTCTEDYDDCGSGLKRCTVKGVVHYSR